MRHIARLALPDEGGLDLLPQRLEVVLERHVHEHLASPRLDTQAVNPRQAGEAHEELPAQRDCLDVGILLADDPSADPRGDPPVGHQRHVLISQHAQYRGHGP
jgi:hypothetical protein